MRCIFTNETIGMTSFVYWYQSYHWYQGTIGLTNRIGLCILDMCEMLRNPDENRPFLIQITASHTCVRFNTHLPPPFR